MSTKAIVEESLRRWEENLQRVLDFKNGFGKSGLLLTDEFLGLSCMTVEDDPFCIACSNQCESCSFCKANNNLSCKHDNSICIQLEDAVDNLYDCLSAGKDWKEAIDTVIEKINQMIALVRKQI